MKRKEYIDWLNGEIAHRIHEIEYIEKHKDILSILDKHQHTQLNEQENLSPATRIFYLKVELAMLRICLNKFKGR
jgi:hypothetical protein